MRQSYPDIPIIDRMTLVLNEVLSTPYGLTSADLAKKVDMPKTTLYRLLAAMNKNGFLRLNEETGVYIPGNRFTYAYYTISANYSNLKRTAQAYLEDLSTESMQTVMLSVLSRSSALSLSVVEGSKPVRIALDEDFTFPLHASASGKVLMNSLGTADIDHYLRHHVDEFTQNTITDPESIKSELQKVRKNGYATDFEEFLSDVCSVACPIFDQNKNIMAAVAMAIPAKDMHSHDTAKIVEMLERTSRRIQRAMKTVNETSKRTLSVIGPRNQTSEL